MRLCVCLQVFERKGERRSNRLDGDGEKQLFPL